MRLPLGRLGIGTCLALGGASAFAGCEDVSVVVVDAASVEISPEEVRVFEGDEQAVTAIVRSSSGAILSGRSVVWTIDDSVVAVVSGTGILRGEQPGTTTVRVRTEGLVGTAPVTVLRRPEIGLSAQEVEILGVRGEEDPPDEVVEVVNAGEGTLSGLSLVVETGGNNTSWLSASLGGTVAPTTLTISTSVGNSWPGMYEGTVLVLSPEAANSPQEVQVTLFVREPSPSIGLEPPSVFFSTVSGSFEPATQSVGVTNVGGGTLRELSATIDYGDGRTDWLSAELRSTRAPTILDLAASARNLAPGTYRAEVEVSSPLIPEDSRSVEVVLQVSPGGDTTP